MKNFSLVFLSAFICFSLFAQTQNSSVKFINPKSNYEKAGQLYKEGNYKKALELLDEINENDSIYLASLVRKTDILMDEKKYDEVIDICNQNLDPQNEKFYDLAFAKGLALLRDEKYQASIDWYAWLSKYYPKSHLIVYNMAVANAQLENYTKAIELYQECILYNAYYAPPHLALGNLCFHEDKISQALLCWDTYLMLNPSTKKSLEVLTIANKAVSQKMDKNSKNIQISVDDESFKQCDLMIENKIALAKGYKIPNKIDPAFVKQNYALLELLKTYKGNGGFWSEKYVPMFLKLQQNNQFENFIYRMLASTTNEEYVKVLKKEAKDLKSFINWYANEWTELLGRGNDKENPNNRYFYSNNGTISSIGFADEQNIYDGNFTYFTTGRILSTGEFTNDKRSGHWTWYYPWGEKKEELEYNNSGSPNGLYTLYHPNGHLLSSVKLIGDYYQGEYLKYNKYGFLEERSFYIDDFYNDTSFLYHPLGKDYIQVKIPYTNGETHGKLIKYFPNGIISMEAEFSNGKRIKEEKQYFKNGDISYIYNYLDGELNGPYKSYYNNGKLHTEGAYRNGKADGKWKFYYLATGNLSEERNYIEGLLNGENIVYDYDGSITYKAVLSKGNLVSYSYYTRDEVLLKKVDKISKEEVYTSYYRNGNINSFGKLNNDQAYEGTWKFYTLYGALDSKEEYLNGEIVGVDSSYYSNGNLASITTYFEGKANGLHQSFYINGALKEEGYYTDGKLDRVWKTYYIDGTLEAENFYINGEQTGYQYEYSNDGKLYNRDYISDGFLKLTIVYDSLGNITDTIDYYADTISYEYYTNRKIKSITHRKNGYKHGKFISYYWNGQISAEGNFFMGENNGEWVWYSDKGQVLIKGNYIDGLENGEWISYYENGKVRKVSNYKNGSLHGTYKTYSVYGKIDYLAEYVNNELNGEARYYSPEGDLNMVRYYEYDELLGYAYPNKDGNIVPIIPIKNGNLKVVTYFDNNQKGREFEINKGEFDDTYTAYYKNGKTESVSQYLAGYLNGEKLQYYTNGQLFEKKNFVYGNLQGEYLKYYKSGQLKEKLLFHNNERIGKGQFYNEDGTIYREEYYFNGEVSYAKYY